VTVVDDPFFDGARVGPDPEREAARPRQPTASAGFGSPGSDFTVKRIDFNDVLVSHPQATFVMRMAGDAMTPAGIRAGDVLVVDRALHAHPGQFVIARLDNELVCRRLVQGADFMALEAGEGQERVLCDERHPLEVWGVVTFVIHATPR
jgi:DNA polymerase V